MELTEYETEVAAGLAEAIETGGKEFSAPDYLKQHLPDSTRAKRSEVIRTANRIIRGRIEESQGAEMKVTFSPPAPPAPPAPKEETPESLQGLHVTRATADGEGSVSGLTPGAVYLFVPLGGGAKLERVPDAVVAGGTRKTLIVSGVFQD